MFNVRGGLIVDPEIRIILNIGIIIEVFEIDNNLLSAIEELSKRESEQSFVESIVYFNKNNLLMTSKVEKYYFDYRYSPENLIQYFRKIPKKSPKTILQDPYVHYFHFEPSLIHCNKYFEFELMEIDLKQNSIVSLVKSLYKKTNSLWERRKFHHKKSEIDYSILKCLTSLIVIQSSLT